AARTVHPAPESQRPNTEHGEDPRAAAGRCASEDGAHGKGSPSMMDERRQRKTRVGVVLSDKMDKTAVVRVETTHRHPMNSKQLRHVRKFKAHTAENQARAGDRVLIEETRPLSKEKRWRIVQILEKAK